MSKANGPITTVYIGGSVEVQISGTMRLTTTYYFFGGARIAMRVGANVTFLHGDRLGSASLATDAAGNVLSQERHYVWGSASMMSGTMPTDFQWQNQRRLDESQAGKLYDFNARFFTPVAARFISPDSIVPNPADPQSLNRYTAMANNPLKFTDPTGHMEISHRDDGVCWNCAAWPPVVNRGTSYWNRVVLPAKIQRTIRAAISAHVWRTPALHIQYMWYKKGSSEAYNMATSKAAQDYWAEQDKPASPRPVVANNLPFGVAGPPSPGSPDGIFLAHAGCQLYGPLPSCEYRTLSLTVKILTVSIASDNTGHHYFGLGFGASAAPISVNFVEGHIEGGTPANEFLTGFSTWIGGGAVYGGGRTTPHNFRQNLDGAWEAGYGTSQFVVNALQVTFLKTDSDETSTWLPNLAGR